MSCGKLHEPGQELHLHAPGEEHAEDDGTQETESGATLAEAAPKPPGRVRTALAATSGQVRTTAGGAWAQHGYLMKPFGWIPAVEGSEWFIHHLFAGDPLHALAAAAAAAAAAEIATETVGHVQKRAHPVRARSRLAVGAAAAWMMIGGAGPFDGVVALMTLATGGLVGGMLAYEKHKAHKDRPPAVEAAAGPAAITAGPDPRLNLFIFRFCVPGGPLEGVTASGFREVPAGFMFELSFTDTSHSPADVSALEVPIAKLYNIRRDNVSVDYIPGNESENFCQVIIRKTAVISAEDRRSPAVNRWGGAGTWNPATGDVDLGRFTDGEIAHYRLHMPHSGSALGMAAGAMRSGKTGTVHVLGCEAGLAMLCSRCGRAGNIYSPGLCAGGCDMNRVMAVWMGDAQALSLGVWQGRADLTGWGPGGCVELLEFADEVAAARARERSAIEWWDTGPDGRRRHNRGKGAFDVEIGWPLVFLVMDEFPMLVNDPDPAVRKTAQRLAVKAVTQWSKLGIHLMIGAQTLDTTLTGQREIRELIKVFNSIAHRADEVSSNMGGITGDPRRLSRDVPGSGYINGPDGRPGTEFATKYAPVNCLPGDTGTDIRHVAGIIAQTPLTYDPGTVSVMEAWNLSHQTVFEEWTRHPDRLDDNQPVPYEGLAAVPALGAPAPAGPGKAYYREDAEKVRGCLLSRPGPWTFPELMRETAPRPGQEGHSLSLGAVRAACEALESNGHAVRAGDRQYQAA